jgi:hypothetical protein
MKLKSFNQFLNERVSVNIVDCDNCDWSWNLQDGGDDMYVCHECGYDNDPSLNEIKNKDRKKPLVGHTRKRGYYKEDPPDIGLYSKGGRDAIKGTGYANKEKANYTVGELDKLMKDGERTWAMSIATTMETRAKKHRNQTQGMRDAMKIFRTWIDKNKKKK